MIDTINECTLSANDHQFMQSTARINEAADKLVVLSDSMSFSIFFCGVVCCMCVLLLLLAEMVRSRSKNTANTLYAVVIAVMVSMAAWWGYMYLEQEGFEREIGKNALILEQLSAPSVKIFNACKVGSGVVREYGDNDKPNEISTYSEVINVPDTLTKKPFVH